MFWVGGTLFYDDFFIRDQSDPTFKAPWVVAPRDNPGDEACIFMLWGDGTMSLASANVQEAYRSYVARLIVT